MPLDWRSAVDALLLKVADLSREIREQQKRIDALTRAVQRRQEDRLARTRSQLRRR
jgi:uncharacterized protein YeeX (DUF496 family)